MREEGRDESGGGCKSGGERKREGGWGDGKSFTKVRLAHFLFSFFHPLAHSLSSRLYFFLPPPPHPTTHPPVLPLYPHAGHEFTGRVKVSREKRKLSLMAVFLGRNTLKRWNKNEKSCLYVLPVIPDARASLSASFLAPCSSAKLEERKEDKKKAKDGGG